MNWMRGFIVCLLYWDKLWSIFRQSTYNCSMGFGCVGHRSLLFLVMDMSPSKKCWYNFVPSGVMMSMRVKYWRYKWYAFDFPGVGVSGIILSIRFKINLSFVCCKRNYWINYTYKLNSYLIKLCTRLLSQTLLIYFVFTLGNCRISLHNPEFNW